MESFFAVVASVSLLFSWVAGTKLAAAHVDATPVRQACAANIEYQVTAAQNAMSLATATVAPFGRIEAGWKIYAPQIAHTIGTPCAPDTQDFAATLASWQRQHRLPATGTVNAVTIVAMKTSWQKARPFVVAFEKGMPCPAAPAEATLAEITAREGWFGKISKLDPQALAALRKMVAAARAEDPRIAHDGQLMQIVSAFRSPEYDAARCAKEKNCNGRVRASCSAHRTGRAVDLNIGALPGHSPVGSDDANRLYQTQTPAYLWLVKNASRFGFVNYVFEPWHWEWVGTTPSQPHLITAEAEEPVTLRPAVQEASLMPTKPLATLVAKLRAMFGSAS
jgi:LAS superfamily LD-carboxypeptidase LdcB